MGSLSVLSVGGGDITISFDKNNPSEIIRAKRIIKDMLRRGYALLVEVNGAYQRVMNFDENVGTYIIADYDPESEQPDEQEQVQKTRQEAAPAIKKEIPGRKSGPRRRHLEMESADAIAIARSAGG